MRVFITLHFDLSLTLVMCCLGAMALSDTATGLSSSTALPDNKHNYEDSDDHESDDESPENATPPRKCKKYTCIFRKEHAKLFS